MAYIKYSMCKSNVRSASSFEKIDFDAIKAEESKEGVEIAESVVKEELVDKAIYDIVSQYISDDAIKQNVLRIITRQTEYIDWANKEATISDLRRKIKRSLSLQSISSDVATQSARNMVSQLVNLYVKNNNYMHFTEDDFENAILELFREQLGYDYVYGPNVMRDYAEPLYVEVLEAVLPQINRGLPQAAIDEAMVKIQIYEGGTLVQKNELFTDYLQNGVAVNYFDGREQCSANVRLVDYDSPLHNRFTIANQWTVDGHSVRRADMIVFVNGLPLVVVELKSPSRENTDVSEAYAQLRNYMQEIPSLFIYNAFCVMSDQAMTKAGTITAGEDRFMQWKTVDGSYEDTHSANFDVLFAGMFEKRGLLNCCGILFVIRKTVNRILRY